MDVAIKDIFFARFFNPYTAEGVQVTGFFENLDFSDYSEELTILTDIVAKNINLYLYNEYSQRYVVSTWARYMTWDKSNKRYTIDPAFYDDFSAALCGHLLTAQNFFLLTQIDFSDLTDTITKTIIHGARSKTRTKGNDTTTVGARTDNSTNNIGSQQNTESESLGAQSTTNTNVYGATSDTTVNTNQLHPFDAAAFIDDSKTTTGKDSTAHTDTLTAATTATSNTRNYTTGARGDTAQYVTGSQETTKTYGTEGISDASATDSEKTTSVRGFDREKLVKIKAELAKLNIYELIGDAIAATMLRKDFGGDCV